MEIKLPQDLMNSPEVSHGDHEEFKIVPETINGPDLEIIKAQGFIRMELPPVAFQWPEIMKSADLTHATSK